MDAIMEMRLLFVLAITGLAVGALGLAMLAQWLFDRIARGRASRLGEARVDHSRQRLEHELGARSARWRMLL